MAEGTAEVVVVGAGVIGSSIAYHLASQGREVLVLDRAGPAREPAASWASAGGVRRQGRDAAEVALAIEAIARWPGLADELSADLLYRQGGNLKLATSEPDAEELADFVRLQRDHGLDDARLIDRQEITALVPGIDRRALAGAFAPRDGQADPRLTTRAFADAAARRGATYRLASVTGLRLDAAGRVASVQTDAGAVVGEEVVVAAGAGSRALLATAGLHVPLRAAALQMLLSTPDLPVSLGPVLSVVGRLLSLKQLPTGEYLIGGGWPGRLGADEWSYAMEPDSVSRSWAVASETLPAVGTQGLLRRWCGIEAMSFDGIPLIGRVPEVPNLVLAAGFSGHGFALCPAVGRAVADLLAGRPTPQLEGLSPLRAAPFSAERCAALLAEHPDAERSAG